MSGALPPVCSFSFSRALSAVWLFSQIRGLVIPRAARATTRAAAAAGRALGAAQLTFCKSGKDRTGMAITLQEARLLGEVRAIDRIDAPVAGGTRTSCPVASRRVVTRRVVRSEAAGGPTDHRLAPRSDNDALVSRRCRLNRTRAPHVSAGACARRVLPILTLWRAPCVFASCVLLGVLLLLSACFTLCGGSLCPRPPAGAFSHVGHGGGRSRLGRRRRHGRARRDAAAGQRAARARRSARHRREERRSAQVRRRCFCACDSSRFERPCALDASRATPHRPWIHKGTRLMHFNCSSCRTSIGRPRSALTTS